MNKFEKFLFFYSIIAVTSLFVSFGILSPKPLNLISLTILSPIIFYFWIRLTSPQSVSAEKWSLRLLLVIIVISGLGIFGYYLTRIPVPVPQELPVRQATPSPTQTPPTAREATKSGETIVDFLQDSPTPIPLQEFTGKPGVKSINVYASPSTSSNKISTLDPTQTYLYLLKKNGWYEIALSESEMGWVSDSQIQEVQ